MMPSDAAGPASPRPRAGLRVPLAVLAALAAACLLAYGPVRGLGFVFDDIGYITENPTVQGGLTGHGLAWALTATTGDHWHPLTWLSHMADVTLLGPAPAGHHLMNLLWHILNTALLFLLLRRLTGALGRSAFVAALFALHPFHVETVAWVADRKDLLCTFFFLLALWAYAGYAERPGARRYAAVLLAFILSLLSKSMMLTLPFVLLLLDLWPLGRWRPQPAAVAPPRRLLLEKVPLLVLSAGFGLVSFLIMKRPSDPFLQDPTRLDLLGMAFKNALLSYLSYLAKTFWPRDLAVLYPFRQSVPLWQAAGAAGLLLAVSLAALRFGRRLPYLTVGWFWFLATLVPVIGIVPGGPLPMADRYTYVPLVGLFVIIAWGAHDLAAALRVPPRHARAGLAAAAAAALIPLALATHHQVGFWRDAPALFGHARAVNARNPIVYHNLAVALAHEGATEEAITLYREALRLDPDLWAAHVNLGVLLVRQGRPAEARTHYAAALRLNPGSPQVHYNLGDAFTAEGRRAEAEAEYREAIRLDPNFAYAHNNLALVLMAQGRHAEAMAELREAERLDPQIARAHRRLADAMARLGQGAPPPTTP